MYSHTLDQAPSRAIHYQWFLLSFSGGCINAGGFLATGRFVSHVTGFATLSGVEMIRNNWESALGILSVPFFFLLGAITAGLWIERPIYRGQTPHYDWVMGSAAACLTICSLAGFLDSFGDFGASFLLRNTYFLMALLCLACGLQNAAISAASRSSVRTTHLTGLTTDLGLGIARLLSDTIARKNVQHQLQLNWLRTGCIVSFIVGSGLGAFSFRALHYGGFLIPAAIAYYSCWQGRLLKKNG